MGENNQSDSDSVTLRDRSWTFSKTDTTPIRCNIFCFREERFYGALLATGVVSWRL